MLSGYFEPPYLYDKFIIPSSLFQYFSYINKYNSNNNFVTNPKYLILPIYNHKYSVQSKI